MTALFPGWWHENKADGTLSRHPLGARWKSPSAHQAISPSPHRNNPANGNALQGTSPVGTPLPPPIFLPPPYTDIHAHMDAAAGR